MAFAGCSPPEAEPPVARDSLEQHDGEIRWYAARRDDGAGLQPIPVLSRPAVPPLTPLPPGKPFGSQPSQPPEPIYSSFFGGEAEGGRIAYVIDYSGSMLEDGREDLLRSEMTRSLTALPGSAKYAIIMFMGEAWRHEESPSHEARFVDAQEGWIPATSANVTKSLDILRRFTVEKANESSLLGGTDWESGLATALAMRPKPDVVYFMTDGLTDTAPPDVAEAAKGIDGLLERLTGWSPELASSVGETDEDLARRMGRVNAAGGNPAVIHTVSMMEPEAGRALELLARENGGTFSIVKEGGSVEVLGRP